jgi:two-component system alkaline phosphatase synthesis response regulator PhoP
MGKKILIVEDRRFIMQIISSTLEPEGFKLTSALNNKEAMALIKKTKYDMIFLNTVLFSETEIEKLIKEEKVPFIFIPLMGMQEPYHDLAMELGAKDVLVLPFKPEKLIDLVKTHIG